jgi:hypothetical protein
MVYKEFKAVKHEWREGFPSHGVNANDANAVLDAIYERDGAITPEAIVDAARPKTAVLHPLIEWDRTKAALQFQLGQARDIRAAIKTVYVRLIDETPKDPLIVQTWIAHPVEDAPRFVPTVSVLEDPEARARLVRVALREAESWKDRHRMLHELADIFQAIELHLEDLKGEGD